MFLNTKLFKITTDEQKKLGEVFTPLKLVNEMLDKLPKEVWTDKNLKWLEPAGGFGVFIITVYSRLMEGLKGVIKCDPKEREHYIKENMLYYNEYNEKNVEVYKLIMNPTGKFKLNIHRGDYLTKDYNFNFDIIIGNPPYQPENTKSSKANGHLLWDKFVKISLQSLKTDGYLVYVHPLLWRKPTSEKSKTNGLFELMTKENQMLYLEIHGSKDGLKTFGCATKYDFYVIQKTKGVKNTTVVDVNGKKHSINMGEWKFLPNYNFENIKKILLKGGEKCCDVRYGSTYGTERKYVQYEKTDEFKYPVVHATNKKGVRYVYSKVNDKGLVWTKEINFWSDWYK